MDLPIEMRQVLVELKYPFIGAMNDNHVVSLFNEKNLPSFLNWYMSKLTEQSYVCSYSLDEIAEYLLHAGVCASSEIQSFVSAKLPHQRMMQILLAMLRRLTHLDETVDEDALESIDSLMEELEERIHSLSITAECKNHISRTERLERIREIERELEEEAEMTMESKSKSEEAMKRIVSDLEAFKPNDITSSLKDFQSVLPRLLSTRNSGSDLPDNTSQRGFSDEFITNLASCYRNGKLLENFAESCQAIQRYRSETKVSEPVDESNELFEFIQRMMSIVQSGNQKTLTST